MANLLLVQVQFPNQLLLLKQAQMEARNQRHLLRNQHRNKLNLLLSQPNQHLQEEYVFFFYYLLCYGLYLVEYVCCETAFNCERK